MQESRAMAQRLAYGFLLRAAGLRGVVVHDDSFLVTAPPTPFPALGRLPAAFPLQGRGAAARYPAAGMANWNLETLISNLFLQCFKPFCTFVGKQSY